MKDQSDLIEELLFMEESAALDFKRDQYPFMGADNKVKSELLKDVLAFVNAFRRVDAYILIGVEEVQGGRSNVVGVQMQLDDAQLQQFVNSKTQVPVTFSYRAAKHNGRQIGIIHIPVQNRPVYAKVNYGKVVKGAVYIRHGSSTAIATPEEIARMGAPATAATDQPTVRLHLVDRGTGGGIGDNVVVEGITWFDVPRQSEIPDYRPSNRGGIGMATLLDLEPSRNSSYYRELAEYLQTDGCFLATLELENTSGVVIHDVRLALELDDSGRDIRTSQFQR